MSLLAIPIIAVVTLIASVLCFVIVFSSLTRYKTKLAVYSSQYQAQELLVSSLQSAHDNLSVIVNELSIQHHKSLTENILISKQLEHRIKTLQSQLNSQQELIIQLQTDKGDDKFYARAIKLAKRGADIDEISAECELPHAEVEMLISVYQKKSQG